MGPFAEDKEPAARDQPVSRAADSSGNCRHSRRAVGAVAVAPPRPPRGALQGLCFASAAPRHGERRQSMLVKILLDLAAGMPFPGILDNGPDVALRGPS